MLRTITKYAGIIVACTVLGGGISVSAQQNPNIGKTAPPLKVQEWATSKNITQEELADRPYVLEFWATWCPPCRKSIPHLNEVSQRLEPFGLRVLGLSKESLEKVKPFAEKMGMVYYVGASHEISGLEYQGIPFAAVVGVDGKIVWAGHPMEPAFEKVLWATTRSYAPEELREALDRAKAGPLGPAYKELEGSDAEQAQKGLDIITENLQLRIKQAAGLEGIEKYDALHEIITLYEGVPGAKAVSEKLAEVLKETEVKKQVEQHKKVRELSAKMEALQVEAMKAVGQDSPTEFQAYYFKKAIPILEAFLEENSDHPEAPQIEKGVTTLKNRLKQLEEE